MVFLNVHMYNGIYFWKLKVVSKISELLLKSKALDSPVLPSFLIGSKDGIQIKP